MECPKCGFEIENNHTICRGCGESVLNLTKLANNNITTTIPSKIENHIITNEERAQIRQILEKEKMNIKNEVSLPTKEEQLEKNNTFCKKCGTKLEEDWLFCPECKIKLNEDLKSEEKYIPTKKEETIVNVFIGWMVVINILHILGWVLELFTFDSSILAVVFLGYFSLPAMILISYGKAKYPKNKKIKNMFSCYVVFLIILILVSAIAFGLLMASCVDTCRTMG